MMKCKRSSHLRNIFTRLDFSQVETFNDTSFRPIPGQVLTNTSSTFIHQISIIKGY